MATGQAIHNRGVAKPDKFRLNAVGGKLVLNFFKRSPGTSILMAGAIDK